MSPLERDYIMRMIAVLATFLQRVLLRKGGREYAEATRELDHASRSLLGFELALLNQFSPAQLEQFFGSDPDMKMTKRYVAGVLLEEEASILLEQGRTDEANGLFSSSFVFLVDALRESGSPVADDHLGRIEQAASVLQGLPRSVDAEGRLFWLHEYAGRYDKAEDALFDLLERGADIGEEGRLFYERLLQKSDNELVQGHLPREEVYEGIRELKKRSLGSAASGSPGESAG